MMTATYNFALQVVPNNREALVIAGMMVGTFVNFLLGIFNPASISNAGPDWLWMGGKNDIIRNLYFRPDGCFRRFGRVALLGTLFAGTAAMYWMLHRI
jgi:hypothetical protein